MCGRQEDSGVIIMVPPAGREEIGISAATSIGTTRLAVDNTVTLTGRGSTMILLGSTNPPQAIEVTQVNASPGALSPPCGTSLSHTVEAESCRKPLDCPPDGREGCRTTMSHRRRSTGLWLRGTVYQYRVRVPVELRQRLGRSHVNRSLRTSSYAEAIRMARRVAFEIEGMFDAARQGVGSDPVNAVCDGACSQPSSPSVTAATVLPGTGPVIHIDLDLLASRIAEKLQAAPPAPAVSPTLSLDIVPANRYR